MEKDEISIKLMEIENKHLIELLEIQAKEILDNNEIIEKLLAENKDLKAILKDELDLDYNDKDLRKALNEKG
jgi:hypothetical protein